MPILNKDNTIVFACGMIKKEVTYVMETNDLDYPVVWLEKGLHEFPEKLKTELEECLTQCQDRDYAILLYGMCGYAVLGLYSDSSMLIIPKFDDCVRMLMCHEVGKPIPTKADYLYLTDAWVTSDKFILNEFDTYIESYGEEMGKEIAQMMIGNYSGIEMIDDGTYDAVDCMESIREKAESYGLQCSCVGGTLRVLEKILLGQWDEEVVVKKRGEIVCMEDFEDRAKCI